MAGLANQADARHNPAMNRRILVLAALVAGFAGIVGLIATSGTAPKAAFDMTEARLRVLTDGDGVVLDLTEIGRREHTLSKTPCQATRKVRLARSGALAVEQTCTDEQAKRLIDNSAGTWHVTGNALCLDVGALDRESACSRVEYRDGTFALLDRQLNVRWTMTAENPRFQSYKDMVEALAAH